MPALLFKTLTQQSFSVEVEDTATIAEVKQKIEEAQGKEFPAENQKLIYNGRVLEDAMLVSSLNFSAPKHIVIMVMRKPAQAASKPETSAAPAEQNKTTADSQAPKTEKSAGGTVSNTPVTQSNSNESEIKVPSEHLQTVANIEAMGYPRKEVIRALQAAFFDADRAVEYLCSGVPEGLSLQQINSGSEDSAPPNEAGHNAPLDDEGLAFLAQSPQFEQLRQIVRTDPSMLPQIIQEIAATNPELMETIRNNQEAFLQLLNAPGAGDGGGVRATAGEAQRQGTVTIPATPQDRQAITRLVSMGFPEPLVVEAYFACDKNEDLAVNYILSRLEEYQSEGDRYQGAQ